MSDPAFVQISFNILPSMPEDMKMLILLAFTNYYTTYKPKEYPDDEVVKEALNKYPDISKFWRNDCYHNIGLQKCQLDEWDLKSSDGKFGIGVSVTTLPRGHDDLQDFLKLVGPYISSAVSSIGYQHKTDFGTTAYYYYFDSKGNIREKVLEPEDTDDIIYYKEN